MLYFILQCLYLVLPAYFGNMAPVFFRKAKFLNYPVDFGMTFRGRPVFGSHKTFRGLFFGALLGVITAYVQLILSDFPVFYKFGLIDYSHDWLLAGFLLGLGAVLGDLIKSFFKRQFGIESGKPWRPFDQMDFAIGAALFLYVFVLRRLDVVLVVIAASPLLHVLVNHFAYYTGIRKEKW